MLAVYSMRNGWVSQYDDAIYHKSDIERLATAVFAYMVGAFDKYDSFLVSAYMRIGGTLSDNPYHDIASRRYVVGRRHRHRCPDRVESLLFPDEWEDGFRTVSGLLDNISRIGCW
jgi:hypothetical protein